MLVVAMDRGTLEHDNQGLRGFLALVQDQFPDQLLRITEPVSTHLDITSTVLELERYGRSPVVIFENVETHDMRVVTNVARQSDATRHGAWRGCRYPTDSVSREMSELHPGRRRRSCAMAGGHH